MPFFQNNLEESVNNNVHCRYKLHIDKHMFHKTVAVHHKKKYFHLIFERFQEVGTSIKEMF